ncbi:MAG: hypothetical protein ACI8XB_001347 [Patiriisocius sp.]|jgi:hypothetical protein
MMNSFIKKTEDQLDLEEWSGEKHHSLPVPGIYVIKDNKVEFQYVNPKYSDRLKPETLLAILKSPQVQNINHLADFNFLILIENF